MRAFAGAPGDLCFPLTRTYMDARIRRLRASLMASIFFGVKERERAVYGTIPFTGARIRDLSEYRCEHQYHYRPNRGLRRNDQNR
jgi:hypothetical protein